VLVTCPSSLCATCRASWLRCSHDDGEFPCCFHFAWMFAAWTCVISAPYGTTVPFECAHDEPFQSLALFYFIHFSRGETGGTDVRGRSGPAYLGLSYTRLPGPDDGGIGPRQEDLNFASG